MSVEKEQDIPVASEGDPYLGPSADDLWIGRRRLFHSQPCVDRHGWGWPKARPTTTHCTGERRGERDRTASPHLRVAPCPSINMRTRGVDNRRAEKHAHHEPDAARRHGRDGAYLRGRHGRHPRRVAAWVACAPTCVAACTACAFSSSCRFVPHIFAIHRHGVHRILFHWKSGSGLSPSVVPVSCSWWAMLLPP